jgi:hypothetical protein
MKQREALVALIERKSAGSPLNPYIRQQYVPVVQAEILYFRDRSTVGIRQNIQPFTSGMTGIDQLLTCTEDQRRAAAFTSTA